VAQQSLKRWVVSRLGFTLFAASVLSFTTSLLVLRQQFDSAERKQLQQELARVAATLERELAGLRSRARDYGSWDDTYRYLDDRDAGYVETNFTTELSANLGVDWVAVLDLQRQPVITRRVQPERTGETLTGKEIAAIAAMVPRQPPALDAAEGSALHWLDEEPTLIGYAVVTDSARAAPPRGWLVFGRSGSGPLLERLRVATGTGFRLARGSGPGSSRIERQGAHWHGEVPFGGDDTRIVLDNAPRFSTESSTTTWLLAINAVVVGGLALLGIWRVLDRRILSRLAQFSDLANASRRDRTAAQPWPVGGSDELDDLAVAHNDLMTEVRAQQDELARLAHRDPLTGLDNRRRLMDRMNEELAESYRSSARPCALMLIDIDDLKRINDRIGHAAGDAVLLAIADRIRQRLGTEDTAARLGGDELAVLLPNRDLAAALSLAETLRSDLSRCVRHDGRDLAVSVSIGVAVASDGSPGSLLHQADIAMYAAKREGKDRVAAYKPA